ncbi:hypothetical protein [Deefgea piscis]|uniref:hypothetical protein n=1 Tax=Deefgea piscis TaxID=2739061 RepID=UPI001C7FBBA2|nr:hypothetical protein [Deefgea piscis]QZA80234.1 hypothetical protein K4H25_11900 [Deefgea piscis]
MTEKTEQATDQVTEQVNQKTADDGGFLLPSGKRAKQIEPMGKHIKLARRAQAGGADYLFAMIAQITKIDGKGIVAEELDEFTAVDVNLLIEVTLGKL